MQPYTHIHIDELPSGMRNLNPHPDVTVHADIPDRPVVTIGGAVVFYGPRAEMRRMFCEAVQAIDGLEGE